MRNIFLFWLPLTIIAAAGCGGSQPDERAARYALERDLTLVSKPTGRAVVLPDRAVASELELRVSRTQRSASASSQKVVRPRKAVRRSARHLAAKAAEPVRPATIARPTIADVVAPNPGTQPVAAIPADSRELPPGKTISLIPTSSGPSPSGERGMDDIPLSGTGWRGMGGGSGMGGSGMGGGCKPGRGTGIPELGGSPRPRGMLY